MTDAAPRTTGDVYAAYDALVRTVEHWVGEVAPRAPGCEDRHVRARVVQRIIEVTEAGATGHLQRGALPPTCRVGGLTVDTATGRVRIAPRLYLRSVGTFLAVWGSALLAMLRALVGPAPSRPGRATILMEGGGGFQHSDARFAEFCRRGPVTVLSEAATVVVQSLQVPKEATDPRLVYARRPLDGLVTHVLSRRGRVSLLVRHLLAPWGYLRAIARCRVAVLISHDMALVPAYGWLGQRRMVEAIVTTTSLFGGQPLWMTGLAGQPYPLHMIWYSQNFIPKMYRGDTVRPNLPAARHMRVDVHWVWTTGFRDYLKELGSRAAIHVVGPIVWYLPAPVEGITLDAINIAVFDIAPLPDGKTAFGASTNYYSVARISQFVTDIVSAARRLSTTTGRPVRILLKHKRAIKTGFHDSTYVNLLDEMAGRDPWFRLIDHETNLFGFLDRCDLSVSVPYTSTAYLSAHLGKPGLYYDPGGTLVPRFEPHPLVRFASDTEALETLMRECVDRT